MDALPCRSPVGSVPQTPPPNACTAYDNNNEANLAKQQLKQHPPSSQPGAGDSTPGQGKHKPPKTSGGRFCHRIHLNSLWSVWYGFFGTFLQAYAAVKCTKRFLRYSVLPWGDLSAVWELHGCFVVTGLAVMLLPLFLASAVFKVGNYANDGYKLGRGQARLSQPTSSRPCGALWRHAGPTAAFLHLVIAAALLGPRLVMEARLVQHGFLPADALWRTDLDFMVVHEDRLVVLSFMTAASSNQSTTLSPVPHGHPVDAMALTAHNATNLGGLQATGNRSLAHDILQYLKDLFEMTEGDTSGIETHVEPGFGSTVSVEYLNYAIALLVYSVRYPAVFWATNKYFGTIFSIQLLANSIQSIISFAGMSVLYKVQVIGAYKALPLLRHNPKSASSLAGPDSPFLLNPHVTLALFALANFLVLASSMILYLYGHARYNSFLSSLKDRSAHITPAGWGGGVGTSTGWGYRTHCAALAALAAAAVSHAPLLHDLAVAYRGSLHGGLLACIVADTVTPCLWVALWLGLTVKHRWTFNVTVTVGRATVRSARSVQLVTDVELAGGKQGSNQSQSQPLLVVGNGRAYTVSETQSRKAIMSVVQKTQQMKRQQQNHGTNGGQSHSSTASSHGGSDWDEEQIYWLRPAVGGTSSPQRSPDSVVGGGALCWGRSASRGGIMKKRHKVTFNEASSTSPRSSGKAMVPPGTSGGGVRIPVDDDGDYATLRELPLIPGAHRGSVGAAPLTEDDSVSEEGKLLACVHDDNVTYASTSRDLIPPVDYEDPSPLLTPEPLDRNTNTPVTVIVHNQLATATPRCLRRADSGVPPEELTPRSGSVSTASSSSPPEVPGSNHSETSSGVHSTASSGEPQRSQPPKTCHVPPSDAAHSRGTAAANSIWNPSDSPSRGTSIASSIWNGLPSDANSRGTSADRNENLILCRGPSAANSIWNVPPSDSPSRCSSAANSIYGTVKAGSSGLNTYSSLPVQEVTEHGIPAVILDTGTDNTLVIRRKSVKPILDPAQVPVIREEPFGRSTNMKMTSFTEHNDLKNVQASSATLPHYPTQPQQAMTSYPHCSTMPLPHSSQNNAPAGNLAAGASCNVYPRQHTTIPIHHNGVRLFPNPYVKRVQQNYQNYTS